MVDNTKRWETDPRILRRAQRLKDLRCSICPPNRGENSKRHAKHGVRPDKSKNRKS